MLDELPRRKNIRLQGYDYSQAGYYFVTICIKEKYELLWSDISVGTRIARPPLSNIGKIVENVINNIPVYYPMILLDKYVIMPNHIHAILIINIEDNGNGEVDGRALRVPTISTVVNQMKGYTTKQVGYSIWQTRFYDRIIRSDNEYHMICQYIDENPARWAEDRDCANDICALR